MVVPVRVHKIRRVSSRRRSRMAMVGRDMEIPPGIAFLAWEWNQIPARFREPHVRSQLSGGLPLPSDRQFPRRFQNRRGLPGASSCRTTSFHSSVETVVLDEVIDGIDRVTHQTARSVLSGKTPRAIQNSNDLKSLPDQYARYAPDTQLSDGGVSLAERFDRQKLRVVIVDSTTAHCQIHNGVATAPRRNRCG